VEAGKLIERASPKMKQRQKKLPLSKKSRTFIH